MTFSPQAPWGQEFCGHCSEVAGRWLGGRSSFKSVNEPGWSLLLILFPWMRCYNVVHHRVISSIKFSGTHSYAWVKRVTVRVQSLAQEHNPMAWPGLEPVLLNCKFTTLTMRPPLLHSGRKGCNKGCNILKPAFLGV